MKQNEIEDIQRKLGTFDYAKLFNVYQTEVDGEKTYYYNVLRKLSFSGKHNIPRAYYTVYHVIDEDTWTLISWKFYGTVKLWWLICIFNEIKNPMTEPETGEQLYIPGDEVVNLALDALEND